MKVLAVLYPDDRPDRHPDVPASAQRALDLGHMLSGAWLVDTARGAIADTDAVREACETGRLGGYAGDTWYPQPAPPDHP